MNRQRLVLFLTVSLVIFLLYYTEILSTSFFPSSFHLLHSNPQPQHSIGTEINGNHAVHGAITTTTTCACPSTSPQTVLTPCSLPSPTVSSSEPAFSSVTEEFDTRIDGLIELFLRNHTVSTFLSEQYTDSSDGAQRYSYLSRTLSRLSLLIDQLNTTMDYVKTNMSHDEIQIIDADLDSLQYPDPSTIQCHLQQDASDLCQYENVCIDIPSDQVSFNTQSNDFYWYLVESHTVSSDATEIDVNNFYRRPLSPFNFDGMTAGTGKDAPERITDVAHAWSKRKQMYRHARRQQGKHGASLYKTVREDNEERLTWDFVDVVAPHPGNQPRAVPFGSYYRPRLIKPEDTLPNLVPGGNFPGFVTWVDNLYTVYSLLHSQLWGFSQGVVFPLFGSVFANESLGLRLPPLDNLYVTADRFKRTEHLSTAWQHKQPYYGYKGDTWVNGFLNDTLEFLSHGHPPFSGFDPTVNTSGISYHALPDRTNGNYPFDNYVQDYIKPIAYDACKDYDTVLAPYVREEYFGGIARTKVTMDNPLNRIAICIMRFAESIHPFNRSGVPSSSSSERTKSIPKFSYQTLRMVNNQPGTRVMFSPRDIPPHPLLRGLLGVYEELAIPIIRANESRPLIGKALELKIHDTDGYRLLYEHMLRYIPHRVCAKRAVLLGNRDTLVGGNAEATFIRKFGVEKGSTPRLDRAYVYPPQQVLILDRGAKPTGADQYGRYFANREEMEEIIQKYNVSYRVLKDEELNKLSFNEQMKIFGRYGLLIIAHGAGECTSAFMPPRSAIIEIYPFGTWCPVFLRMHTASGNHHFSIHSELKGNNLDYSYVEGPKGRRGSPEHEAAALKVAQRCETLGPVGASLTPDCWHENRQANVVVPIAEFEHTFLAAIRAIGIQRYPINSPISLLQGAPNGTYFTDSPLSQLDPEYYRRRRWTVCPVVNTSTEGKIENRTNFAEDEFF